MLHLSPVFHVVLAAMVKQPSPPVRLRRSQSLPHGEGRKRKAAITPIPAGGWQKWWRPISPQKSKWEGANGGVGGVAKISISPLAFAVPTYRLIVHRLV
jgi:hypothetical protein